MRGFLWWGVPFTVLMLVIPAAAADGEKNPAKPDLKEAKAKLLAKGELAGRLVEIDDSEKRLTLRVTLRILVLNTDAAARLAELQQELVQALGIADPAERVSRIQEIKAEVAETKLNLYTVEEHEEDIVLETTDDLVVRTKVLPPVYTEKGFPRKYTAKELKELKGPGNLPGYRAEFADLKAEQTVQVSVVVKKGAKQPVADVKPEATRVVILADPPPEE